MVCPDVDCVQIPLANGSRFTQGRFNGLALRRVQGSRLGLQDVRIVLMPSFVWINVRRLESIVETIDRAALISVQPCAVASKRDQIGERNIGVVPHEGSSYLISAIK